MELLVQIVDKVNPDDPAADAMCYKAGDVIIAQPDGSEWSDRELTNPNWCVLQVPDASAADVSAFLGLEPYDPITDTNFVQQRRGFGFGPLVLALLKVGRVNATRALILAAKRAKARRARFG
jgi:hypothetical protein